MTPGKIVAPAKGFRLLVTDLDGTLLDAQGAICAADRRAIARLQRRGIIVSVATGRMYSGTKEVVRSLGISGPVGCLDGSHIVDASDDSEVAWYGLPTQTLAATAKILTTCRPVTVLFGQNAIFHDAKAEVHLPYIRLWSSRVEQLADALAPANWVDSVRIGAIVCLDVEPVIAQLKQALTEELGSSLQLMDFVARQADALWGLMIRAPGVSKGSAVEHIARHHGVPLAEVVTVGDWINDIPMLETARSFCMAQAPAVVQRAATVTLEAHGSSGGAIAEIAAYCGL